MVHDQRCVLRLDSETISGTFMILTINVTAVYVGPMIYQQPQGQKYVFLTPKINPQKGFSMSISVKKFYIEHELHTSEYFTVKSVTIQKLVVHFDWNGFDREIGKSIQPYRKPGKISMSESSLGAQCVLLSFHKMTKRNDCLIAEQVFMTTRLTCQSTIMYFPSPNNHGPTYMPRIYCIVGQYTRLE